MRWAEHVARIGNRRGGAYRDLVRIFEGKRPLGRFRHRWKNITAIYCKEVGCKAVDRSQLAHHDRDKWRCIANAVMKFWAPRNSRNLNG
jgi:hypothetical protein